MSASNESAAVMRRAGVLGVHSLDHYVLTVPDLVIAEQFYLNFGLDVKAQDGGLGLYTFGNSHCWVKVVKGEKKRLSKVCFACFEDDLPRFEDNFRQLGISYQMVDGAMEFVDPAGMAVSIFVAERTSATALAPIEALGGSAGSRSAPLCSEAARVQPRRLSHLAMFTKDFDDVISFYEKAVGLRLSDRTPGIVCFMHGVHGSDHHMLALLNSTGPGLHHSSWEVTSVNEVGLGATFMARAGSDYQWGVGRHVLGSNYFDYIRDPWGSYIEYSAGMDYVPVDMDYPSADYGPEDSFYLWGPDVPAGFTDNLEQDS